MATIYTLNFTDTTKAPFVIAPYTSNGILSPTDDTMLPNSSGARTTLKLYGKGMQEYGEGKEQNLIYMLENFANKTPPKKSIEGQIWYKNGATGSPSVGAELFVRNDSIDEILGWNAIILASGTSTMTGELILSGTPANPAAAVPKEYVDNLNVLTTNQKTFLDGLNLPSLTSSEVNELDGITGNVQTLLNNKISRTGDNMDVNANLIFNTGEVLGLPLIPSATAATSKEYVDAQIIAGGSDGVLNNINWVGSVLNFNVFKNGSLFNTISVNDISKVGHTHQASTINYNNTLNTSIPPDAQSAIDYLETNKAEKFDPIFSNNITVSNNIIAQTATFTGNPTAAEPFLLNHLTTKNYVDNLLVGTNSLNITRTFESLTSALSAGSPIDVYLVQPHISGDNALSITINGQKQYNSSVGIQQIQYDFNTGSIFNTTFTGLDNSIPYDFSISIDGVPTTITIPAGSTLTTHSDLVNTINAALQIGSPVLDVIFGLQTESGFLEVFSGTTPGSTNIITVSDPSTLNQYLFAVDPTPTVISSAVFNNIASSGSPIIPDEIILAGIDLTATFIVGKTFTIRGSSDPVYGEYDGVYSVHVNGSSFVAGDTIIPIALVNDPSVVNPLFAGSSVPTPSSLGNIHLTPIGGFDVVLPAIQGNDGDYIETNAIGIESPLGETSSHVVFNVTIPAGSKIETILLG